MKQIYVGMVISVLMAGCSSSAFVSALHEDEVIVRAEHANETQVRAEANQGCAIHGRTAEPVTTRCLNESCTAQEFRFACKPSPHSPGSGTSPWLGMSVDNVTDHLHANPPGSSEVVITRIYTDGPARKAGLRVGDIVESFDGVAVENSLTLVELKGNVDIGDRIPLGVRRGAENVSVLIAAEAR